MTGAISTSSLVDLAARVADKLVEQDNASDEPLADNGRGLSGNAGSALFLAAMLQVRENAAYRAGLEARMVAAARSQFPVAGGLFSGIHGLLAVCKYAMRVEPQYSSLLDQCAAAAEQVDPDPTTWLAAQSFDEYDLISGIAGSAAAVAFALSPARARASCDYLIWLTADEDRWLCQHPLTPDKPPQHDIGIAHGLAGIVAALAVAAPSEEPYNLAVARVTQQLCDLRLDPASIGWPTDVGSTGPRYGVSGWCYGTPGCASALLLASRRSGNARFAQIARESLLNLANQKGQQWAMADQGLCHGNAGNALIYAAAASMLGDEHLAQCRDRFIESVLRGFDPNETVDQTDLLTGAPGIGLALITLAGVCDPSWMTLFGLPALADPSTVPS